MITQHKNLHQVAASTLSIVLILILVSSSVLFMSHADAVPRFGEWKPPQFCTPQVKYIVDFRVINDKGYLKPDALVESGSLVRLDGTAVRVIIDRECDVRTIELPFSWALSFTSTDGTKTFPSIIDRDTLNPSFHASDTGKYSVLLSTRLKTKSMNVFAEDGNAFGGTWMSIGPDNISGRITAIAIDPMTKFFYAGAETGGLWRSMDGARSWQTLSDNAVKEWGMPNIKINTLAISRVNDITSIYAGLDIWSGIWIYLPDRDQWVRSGANMGLCQNRELSYSSVYKIVVHPLDPSSLYAATGQGVFRTSDGGTCWEKVLGTAGQSFPIQDLVITRSPIPSIYAAKQGGSIYKATDNNPRSWVFLNDLSGSGLPTSSLGGRTAIAVSDSDPNTLYIGFGPPSQPYRMFKSTSAGLAWTELSSPPNRCDNQCDHNNEIAVHPTNPNVVIVGQVPLYTSVDGGITWVDSSIPNRRPGPHLDYGMHSDILALTFDPFDPSKLYVGTDGGVYEQIIDIINPRPYWTYISNELVTTQFYDSGVAPKERSLVSGGTLDNSNLLRKDAKIWTFIPDSGGDGFHSELDTKSTYANPVVFTNSYWGGMGFGEQIFQHTPASEQRQFIATGYTFFANPYRSTLAIIGSDGQLYHANLVSNAPIVKCIDPTPDNSMDRITSISFLNSFSSTSDYMLVGTIDGSIYAVVPIDGTPGTACGSPNRLVTKIFYDGVIQGCVASDVLTDLTPNPHQQGDIIYATFANSSSTIRVVRIDAIQLEDGYHLCGTDITGDLPIGLVAEHIVMDPVKKGVIHLGTTQGIFLGTFIPSESRWHWTPANGSPPVHITSLEIQQNSENQPPAIRASTFGRGVFELLQPVNQSLSSLLSTDIDTISNCTIREFDDTNNKGRVVAVDIGYSYRPNHGNNVSISPVVMNDGKDLPYFLNEVEKLNHNHGNATLLMMYAANNSLLKLSTDAIRIDMFQPETGVFLSKICNADLTWRNIAGRTLNINAIGIPLEGPTAPISIPISISSSKPVVSNANQASTENSRKVGAINLPQRNAPGEYTYEVGSKINLTVPEQIKTISNNSLKFRSWQINGSEVIMNNSISLVLSDDMNVTAVYQRLEEEKEAPNITIQALCNCPINNTGRYVNSSIPDIPIQYIRGPDIKIVYTPTELGVKSRFVDLEAPEIAPTSNGTLKFSQWTISNNEQEIHYKPDLSLTISNSTIVVAHYEDLAPKTLS